jgi:hypothetical protein
MTLFDVDLLFVPPTNFLIFYEPTDFSISPLLYTVFKCMCLCGRRKVFCVLVCVVVCVCVGVCGCGCVWM